MRLSDTDQSVLNFLSAPKTAAELMDLVGHKTPPYKTLRLLQRLGLAKRISPYARARATFVATGITPDKAIEQLRSDPHIKISAHNPFHLA